jgi:predicted nucleic-acid-binding protein
MRAIDTNILVRAPKTIAQPIEGIAALRNVISGERAAVLMATTRASRGWDFTDALHHALSQGCDAFITLDADLAKRAGRGESGVVKTAPAVVKL